MPPRAGRTPFKNAVRDRRYKAIIEAATAHPTGTWHVIPLTFPDLATAKNHANMIYAEGRYQGFGRQVHYIADDGTHYERAAEVPDGPVQLKFRLFSKESAQAHVAAGRDGKGLAYNTRRKKG